VTGAEVAQRFAKPRKTGKARWVALCPVHGDKSPSLSICEGKKAVLITCRSHGCDLKDICEAAGLQMSDLWYSSHRESKPPRHIFLERQIDIRLHRLGLMLMLHSLDRAKKNYWRRALWGTYEEVCLHWKSIYPADLLPTWMRPRIDRQCSVCGFRWSGGYAGQVCPFTPLPKEDREHVAY
jgi:hypothetical protein